ncbi:hypothetical protein FPQ18DRAFT_279905 [Pyronema domesticum]|uniref:Uncharacterized protein n=1 Tax=Pyronema omphalodes (strain CBS 100304) TaxID=1076935 RepID=U4LIZ1_PYROM|nr:hypothetical protein FPQ18DRAFT_279905 [Pyronema domesticum]CCX32074.1 Similar to hypothetical protein [Tuber melanosporum Mel28]; acc. no. XP_002836133 [Pyronema omphalodes CBS 100304]
MTDPSVTDYETLERRYNLAVNLECWELLAMHSIATDESIPRIRLRMLKAFAGVPPTQEGNQADRSPAGSSGSWKRQGGNGRQ